MCIHFLLCAAHFVFCVILVHSLLFCYFLMPDMTHYIEFVTHKWETWCYAPKLVSAEGDCQLKLAVFFPVSNLSERTETETHVC